MGISKSGYAAISSYGRALSKALDERDVATRRHCDRVIELAGAFGRMCSLDSGAMRQLRLVAALHDIGKIGIPDRVLLKPGRLVGDDWREMQSHTERGERIVLSIAVDGVEEVALAVRHHHEHFDGGGYPDRLAGEDIPFTARMVAIADGYDAMAVARPYHVRRSHEEIMGILGDEEGRKYDPYLLGRFAQMIGESSAKAPSA
ncbi:MAG: HD domain-containing protein [Rhodocyclaceae bacterium]|jgi:response regulator RpfG family c-di-GMP phosphodiesterase|nr:HD domain-containing protein [Rhodocyclaceae bacterium]